MSKDKRKMYWRRSKKFRQTQANKIREFRESWTFKWTFLFPHWFQFLWIINIFFKTGQLMLWRLKLFYQAWEIGTRAWVHCRREIEVVTHKNGCLIGGLNYHILLSFHLRFPYRKWNFRLYLGLSLTLARTWSEMIHCDHWFSLQNTMHQTFR